MTRLLKHVWCRLVNHSSSSGRGGVLICLRCHRLFERDMPKRRSA